MCVPHDVVKSGSGLTWFVVLLPLYPILVLLGSFLFTLSISCCALAPRAC